MTNHSSELEYLRKTCTEHAVAYAKMKALMDQIGGALGTEEPYERYPEIVARIVAQTIESAKTIAANYR